VFECVGDELGQDQPAGNRGVQVQHDPLFDPSFQPDVPTGTMDLEDIPAEILDVIAHVHLGMVAGLVQLLVDQSHGGNAVAAVLEGGECLVGALDGGRLKIEETRDDIEIVLDAIADFLQEDFLFLEASLERFVYPVPFPDFNREPRGALLDESFDPA